MARFGFCISCPSSIELNNANCICDSQQGTCEACTNLAECSQCGNGCCKDCSIPLKCCGLILCGSGRADASNETMQSCFANHKTTDALPCGHCGCNLQNECLACKTKNTSEYMEKKTPAAVKQSFVKTTTTTTMEPAIEATTKQPVDNALSMIARNSKLSASRPVPRSKRAVRSVYQVPTEVPPRSAHPYQEPVEAPRAKRGKKGRIAPIPMTARIVEENGKQHLRFPVLLHAFVTETAQVAPHVISWIGKGTAFVVHDPNSAELGQMLQKYFWHSKYSSLHRQLNIYGFHKAKNGRHKGGFHHPLFHVDRPEEVFRILRRSPPNRSKPAKNEPKLTKHQTAIVKEAPSVKPPPQVLSPNKPIRKERSIQSKHLPPKKRIFPREDTENVPSPQPIVNEMKEKFKAVAGKRPTMAWSTY